MKRATISDAPSMLNMNDKAMWVLGFNAALAAEPPTVKADMRPCTCRPDDNPPKPCPRKFALSECLAAASPPPQSVQLMEPGVAPSGERQRFEAWLRKRWPNANRPIDEKTPAGFYVFNENNFYWEAWQEAIAGVPAAGSGLMEGKDAVREAQIALEAACRAKYDGWDNPRYFGEYAKELRRAEVAAEIAALSQGQQSEQGSRNG